LASKALDHIPFPESLVVVPMIKKFLQQEKAFPEKSIHKLLWGYNDFFLETLDNMTTVLNKEIKKYKFKFPNVSSVNTLIKLQVL
jgi:hypothetical protein